MILMLPSPKGHAGGSLAVSVPRRISDGQPLVEWQVLDVRAVAVLRVDRPFQGLLAVALDYAIGRVHELGDQPVLGTVRQGNSQEHLQRIAVGQHGDLRSGTGRLVFAVE